MIKFAKKRWDSPGVFVHRKNGTLRFCVDYQNSSYSPWGFLSHVNIRLMYRFIVVSSCNFESGCQQWLLADWSWRREQRTDSFYLSSWLISVCKNSLRFKACVRYVLTSCGRNTVNGRVAIRPCIHEYYSYILQDRERLYQIYKTGTPQSKGCRYYTYTKEVFSLQQLNRLDRLCD